MKAPFFTLLVGLIIGLLIPLTWDYFRPFDTTVYDYKIEKLVSDTTRLYARNEVTQKLLDAKIDTEYVYQTKIQNHYEKIFISIHPISYDSSIQLRAVLRGQYRNEN